jgi:phenylpyruvate tautomerase PptA (4-oxalocrotonate tautomerase family)
VPILEIEMVVDGDETPPPGLAQEIADCAGEVFGTPPGHTWVRLRLLPREHYAENGASSERLRPVFVSVLKAVRPEGSALATEVSELTEAIAAACDRPGANVHLIYAPSATGRVAFGARVVGS